MDRASDHAWKGEEEKGNVSFIEYFSSFSFETKAQSMKITTDFLFNVLLLNQDDPVIPIH